MCRKLTAGTRRGVRANYATNGTIIDYAQFKSFDATENALQFYSFLRYFMQQFRVCCARKPC